MTKRFTIEKSAIINGAKVINDKNKEFTFTTTEEIQSLITYEKALNELNDENKELLNELRVYRKIANCYNCNYHDYDDFANDDGSYDEYEVCRKGNDVTAGICEDYKRL